MNKRVFKNKVYQELATIVKALANPHRLEILELLAQRPFSVEEIAGETDLTIANTSQHLQVLKRVQLLNTNKKGTYVYYTLADRSVYEAWKALRDLGLERIAEIERVVRTFRQSRNSFETLTSSELMRKMEAGEVTIIDVRPKHEFGEGHIAGALSIPIDELQERLNELPEDGEIVAYCRGPFCVFADEAVEMLSEKGFSIKRLEEGFPEWALEERPVEYSKN